MPEDAVVIVAAARTAMGGFQGALAPASAPDLGGAAIAAALARAGLDGGAVDELLMGCVLPAGQGQAPARQAGFAAGLPKEVPATTLNKMCGSGMKAVMLAHDALRAGNGSVVVAGGMESMTQRPLPPAEDAGRRAAGARAGAGPHVPRRAGGRLRQGAADGDLRRGLRHRVPVHPGRAGRIRARLAEPGARGAGLGRLRRRDRRGGGERPRRHGRGRRGRAAEDGAAGEDPDAQARLPQGRDGDGGQLLLDLGRRRGAGADARGRGAGARACRCAPGCSGTRATPRSRRASRPPRCRRRGS